jgi:hypothetical protein
MKATITQTSSVNQDSRSKMGRSLIYVESPLDKVANEFALTHGVYNLSFKCKTWSKVCRQVTKTHIVELKKMFPEALDIKFSAKAGCSCGCSPGYVMKHEPNQRGKNFWVNIEASEMEINLVRTSINCARLRYELKEEVDAHKATTV